MKKTVLFLMVTLTALTLIGCSCGQADSASAKDPNQATLTVLLEQANLKQAEIYIHYEMVVPDTAKATMAKWITETVGAASLHMTGGDYEDPEDLVEEVADQARELFEREEKIMSLSFIPKGQDENHRQWIMYNDLTPSQKKVFDFLNR